MSALFAALFAALIPSLGTGIAPSSPRPTPVSVAATAVATVATASASATAVKLEYEGRPRSLGTCARPRHVVTRRVSADRPRFVANVAAADHSDFGFDDGRRSDVPTLRLLPKHRSRPASVDDHAKRGGGAARNLWVMTGGLLAAQVGTLAILSRLPPETTGWGEGSFEQILDNDLRGPKWDTDHGAWNYVAHPVVGSEYYLIARNRGATWWQGALYAAAMSTFWELFTEAYFERPSRQDLVITPVAGVLIGELRYFGKLALQGKSKRPVTGWKRVLVVALDPVDALTGGE